MWFGLMLGRLYKSLWNMKVLNRSGSLQLSKVIPVIFKIKLNLIFQEGIRPSKEKLQNAVKTTKL